MTCSGAVVVKRNKSLTEVQIAMCCRMGEKPYTENLMLTRKSISCRKCVWMLNAEINSKPWLKMRKYKTNCQKIYKSVRNGS